MAGKPAKITIEQKPGSEFECLGEAQRAALPLVSADLQSVIRDLFERGVLVKVDVNNIPNPKPKLLLTNILILRAGFQLVQLYGLIFVIVVDLIKIKVQVSKSRRSLLIANDIT